MYRWFKGGVLMPGKKEATLGIVSAVPGDAGEYHAEVFNGVSVVESVVATVAVREFPRITAQTNGGEFVVGDKVVFSVTATGPGPLSYVWKKGGAVVAGASDGPQLDLGTADLVEAGFYEVVVSNAEGSVTSNLMELRFAANGSEVTEKPAFALTGVLPAGQVGLPYLFRVPMLADPLDGTVRRQAEKFTATGLPTGLVCDKVTGDISGTPKVARTTAFKVTITASNRRGSVKLATTILVAGLPTGFLGSYAGLVERSAALTGGLGGTVVMKVASSGALSGTHDEGGKRRPFRGVVVAQGVPTRQCVANLVIARGRGVPVHFMTVVLEGENGRVIDGTLSDGTTTVAVAGWRNPWGKLNPATALAGYYTATLGWQAAADLAAADLPRGFGFLAVTVTAKTGGARVSGKLMDGSAVTGSTFAGPNGQVLVFRTLYGAKTRGSAHGMVVLSPAAVNAENGLEGCVTWNRPANLAATNRLFRSGFGVKGLEAQGGRYTPPAKGVRILGLTTVPADRARLVLAGADWGTALPAQADTSFAMTTANKAVFVTANNPRKLTFSVNVKTGLFNGTATMKENNPALLPGKVVAVTRRVTYQGILPGRDQEGAGFALVPLLPVVATEQPTKTPIVGAGVILEPVANP
jgi:hypothetical protein